MKQLSSETNGLKLTGGEFAYATLAGICPKVLNTIKALAHAGFFPEQIMQFTKDENDQSNLRDLIASLAKMAAEYIVEYKLFEPILEN